MKVGEGDWVLAEATSLDIALHLKPLWLRCLLASLVLGKEFNQQGWEFHTFWVKWGQCEGWEASSAAGPWVQGFLSQASEMGFRLRPKRPCPPDLLKGGLLALSRMHCLLASPGPRDGASPLPSHAGASGAGLVDEPSLQKVWWRLAPRVVRATR